MADSTQIVEEVPALFCRETRTVSTENGRWPDTPITLRQGARVIEDSRRLRVV
jgi:hypothetical protein